MATCRPLGRWFLKQVKTSTVIVGKIKGIMENLTKDTYVVCPIYNEYFFGTIEQLKEELEDIGEYDNYRVTSVFVANKEPFCIVDDEFIIDMINEKIERIGEDRSSDDGDEMDKVSQIIIDNIKVDYKKIMEKMPTLFYSQGDEINIDLNDF